MVFSKKWLQNHPQFLLHFLIHIDVLILSRKFEMIPTNIFRVMSIYITITIPPITEQLDKIDDSIQKQLQEKLSLLRSLQVRRCYE